MPTLRRSVLPILYTALVVYLVGTFKGWDFFPAAPVLVVGFYLVLMTVLQSGKMSLWLRLAFLTRYSILIGATLPGLVLLAWFGAPNLVRNAFVLHRPVQLFNITWLAFAVATMVLVTFRTTQLNAGERFSEYQQALKQAGAGTLSPAWRHRWWLLFGMGLPIPVACLVWSIPDASSRGASGWIYGLFLAAGMAFAFALLVLLSAIQELLLHPAVSDSGLMPFESWFKGLRTYRSRLLWWAEDRLARGLNHFGRGYAVIHQGKGWLRPGHGQNLLFLLITLAAYLGYFFWVKFTWSIPNGDSPLSSPFFALLPLMLLGFVLTGLAFWLDYYRVPVLLVIVAVSLTLYYRTDHYFELKPLDTSGKVPPTPVDHLLLDDVAGHWNFPKQDGKRTLVVVTAAGGGIQAAAWTAQVLTGLHELYGQDFDRSIGLISAVSGGSVGTMYYLAYGDWEANGDPFHARPGVKPPVEEIRDRSRKSALEATLWGLAYPDSIRVFLPFLVVDPRMDRGWAIEHAWRANLPRRDLHLMDWAPAIQNGNMPIVVFNATLAETGQRLLISPVVKSFERPRDTISAREFLELYKDSTHGTPNPRVTTAVRLSATFPYVSPIARPYRGDRSYSAKELQYDYHVVDGGYVDNEGMVTALDWINHLVPPSGDRRPLRFDRILVVRIEPFPILEPDQAELNAGWLYEAVGPIRALQQVRSASQSERNSMGMDFLTRMLRAGGSGGNDTSRLIPIDHADFVFQPDPDKNPKDIPLSWKLVQKDLKKIDEAWEKIKTGSDSKASLAVMDRYFKRRGP